MLAETQTVASSRPKPFRAREACLALTAALTLLGGCHRQAAAPLAAAPTALRFNREIEPILSENCYPCHGPDPGARKAGLRLDRAEFAYKPHGRSGAAIVPGHPESSPLVQRIGSADLKQVMPPPEAHKTLAASQIALLRRWIREGAAYEDHWSFISPQLPPVPVPRQRGWVQNPLDEFVLARLEQEGLRPSAEADRPTLIRRVTYDLTGLPPTPEEVRAFVADPSATAYEKVVDRLLASPRYGEHRARYWLDVARYGDTHGLHLDDYRSVWPYRDYVIRSFNDNKPFDRFVREQIAGDLYPARDVDQIVATAFIRAGISTGEGGTIPEELRVNNQRERAEAFGAAFLGLTTGCAVCHDHKFDPLTQRDFYRLTAYWNNLAEFAGDQNLEDWPPSIRVPKPERRAAYNRVLAERSELTGQLQARRARARELVPAWWRQGQVRPREISPAGLEVRIRGNEQKGTTLTNSAPSAPVQTVATSGAAPIWGEETWFWPTLRLDTTTRVELPAAGDFDRDQGFSVGTWLKPYLGTDMALTPPFGAIASRNRGARGWGLYFDRGKLTFHLVHSWSGDLILVESAEAVLARNRWNHILATYDGSGRAAGVRLYIDGRPIPTKTIADSLKGSTRTSAPLEWGQEFPHANALAQSTYQDFRLYRRTLAPDEAERLPSEDYVADLVRRPPSDWNTDEFKAVSDFFFRQCDEPSREAAARLPALSAELNRLAEDGDPCLVCEESPRLAYADLLVRGVFNDRGGRVQPGVPGFLPQPPPEAAPNRRTLADWVVSDANPLTTRVVVNRMWQEFFGAGLVETPENFGLMGARPSHPELLDWLAVDFRSSGWDVKRFYRRMALSATYRQSAESSPEAVERDPHNRLLARGPRYRMDAEMIRDTALAASGLLVNLLGGPSVKPYQPKDVWETGTQYYSNTYRYEMGHHDDLHRRSLYTFWKRMVPMPNMETFDAPTRDDSCPRRARSNTPLQALVTMNDPQWLEAARVLGERVIKRCDTPAARIAYLGELLLSRPLRPEETGILDRAFRRFDAIYGRQDRLAAELIDVGESRPDPAIRPTELAPWMLVASTALNLDATLSK